MNGEDILQKVRDAYSKFDTYSDVGTVENLGQPWLPLEFQTCFKRPSNFRFQWLSWHPHFGKSKPPSEDTIYSDGTDHFNIYSGELERVKSFSLLVAGATGVSSGAVHALLNLLRPGSVELRDYWHEATAIRFLPDELLNGFECFHLIGMLNQSDEMEVWIDKDTLTVRQLSETHTTTKEDFDDTQTYLQSVENLEQWEILAKKHALPDHVKEKALDSMLNRSFKPQTSRSIYKYSEVHINQPIDDALFKNLNGGDA